MKKNYSILLKIVVYRILALSLTAIITGLSSAVLIHLLLTVLHYCVEKIWIIFDE